MLDGVMKCFKSKKRLLTVAFCKKSRSKPCRKIVKLVNSRAFDKTAHAHWIRTDGSRGKTTADGKSLRKIVEICRKISKTVRISTEMIVDCLNIVILSREEAKVSFHFTHYHFHAY